MGHTLKTPTFYILTAAISAVMCTGSSYGAVKTTFPRLGGANFGSPQDYQLVSTQTALGRLDYTVIEFYKDWGGGTTAQRAALQGIKSHNPNIVIVDYIIMERIQNTASGAAFARTKLDAQKWWLYKIGTTAPKLDNGDSTSATNITNFVPSDTGGLKWNTWIPNEWYNIMWKNLPELDGVFTDNVFWKPRVNGDWNRDGTTDSQDVATVQGWHRTGYASYFTKLRALLGTKLVVGNIGDWGRPESTTPEYTGKTDGGLLERYIGESWSHEGQDMNGVINSFGSWTRMMNAYRKVMGQVAGPKLVMFGMKGKPTDYRALRYGFGSACLHDGYFAFSNGLSSSLYEPRVVWFDEYDLAGTSTTSWLGTAVDAPPIVAWQKGVWRRVFTGGMVIVNPRGNGVRTVTVEAGYKRFAGNQAPTVNDGQNVTTVTLSDRDGIFLKKI